jgi:DNA-binding transcriptional LysR family regulator
MEVHEIRYFLAVADTLNFTRAAEQCHVSQPALTRAIKSLEDKLGAGPLIHRERRHTHLTEFGRMMMPYFAQVIGQIAQARKKAREFVRLEHTKLTVGLMCTIGPSRLVDLFSAFHRGFTAVDLHLQDGRASVLEDRLSKGELDLALFCKPEPLDGRLHQLPLFTERFLIGIAPGHPLARKNVVHLEDLHLQRYLARVNCEYAEHVNAIATEQGIEIVTPYASDRDDWIQAMALAGLGYTMIPEYAVTLPGLATRLLVEPEVVRNVNLVTVRGRPHSPAVGAFVHEARRYPWAEKMRASAPLAHVAAA